MSWSFFMLRRSWLISSLSASLAALGCESTGAVDLRGAELLVRSDKPSYSLAVDHAARPTLINQGPAPIYAPMNEYVYVEQWSENGWINRTAWFAVDGSTPTLTIAPGDSLTAPAMDFSYVDGRAGTYRFIFEVAYDPHGRHLVAEEDRASEPFQLTRE